MRREGETTYWFDVTRRRKPGTLPVKTNPGKEGVGNCSTGSWWQNWFYKYYTRCGA